MDSENIYNKLDTIRQNKNLSIYSLAKKAGVSCASVYKWRDRKSSPSLYLIESLCEVLNIHIVNLFVKDEDLAYLQEDEKQLFNEWKVLRKDQKELILGLIKSLQKQK